jgi:hypothetical protein
LFDNGKGESFNSGTEEPLNNDENSFSTGKMEELWNYGTDI